MNYYENTLLLMTFAVPNYENLSNRTRGRYHYVLSDSLNIGNVED